MVLKRERSGAASLLGCDLPPAETLAAHAATCARAQVYKDSGAFPGVLMDQFRAMAYLDLMNEVAAGARIAAGPPEVGLGAPGEGAFRDEPEPDDPGAPAPDGSGGSDCPCDECDGRCAPRDDIWPETTSPTTSLTMPTALTMTAEGDGADDDDPDDAGRTMTSPTMVAPASSGPAATEARRRPACPDTGRPTATAAPASDRHRHRPPPPRHHQHLRRRGPRPPDPRPRPSSPT